MRPSSDFVIKYVPFGYSKRELIQRKDNVVNMCERKFYSVDFEVDKGYDELLK